MIIDDWLGEVLSIVYFRRFCGVDDGCLDGMWNLRRIEVVLVDLLRIVNINRVVQMRIIVVFVGFLARRGE